MQGVLRVQRSAESQGTGDTAGFPHRPLTPRASFLSRLQSIESPRAFPRGFPHSSFQSVRAFYVVRISPFRDGALARRASCPRRVRCCYGAALGPAVLFRYLSFLYGPFRLFHITDYPYGFTVAVFVTLSLSLTGTRGDAAAGGTGTRDGPGEASSLLFLTLFVASRLCLEVLIELVSVSFHLCARCRDSWSGRACLCVFP